MQSNEWLIALSAAQVLNAIVVGGIGFYFAHQQRKLARAKLRLDLFDKRFAVFDAARTFIGKALGKLEIEDQNAFLVGASGASFLLNDELAAYLDEILQRAIDLPLLYDDIAHVRNEEEGNEARAKYLAERRWLREQIRDRALEAKFKPLLQLVE